MIFYPYHLAHSEDEAFSFNSQTEKNVIGCLLPLSGEYETLGKKALRGLLTATDLLNSGSSFQLIVKDTGSDRTNIKDSISELAREKVSFVVAPVGTNSIDEVSAGAESYRVPTLVFPLSETNSTDNPYLMKFTYSVEKQADVLAEYAVKVVGIKTFGILHPRTRLGTLFKEAFSKSVKKHGRQVTYTGSYNSNLTNTSTEFEWIKSIQPEALFIPDGASHSGELIMKLKQEVTLGNLLFIGPNTWNSRAFLDIVGKQADGVVFRVLFTDYFYHGEKAWTDFSNKYKSLFDGEEPGFVEYQLYTAIKLTLNPFKTVIPKRDEVMKRLLVETSTERFNITQSIGGSLEISPKPQILTVKDGDIFRLN